MKKYFQFFISAVLCLVAVAMTACGDDDEPQYKIKGDAIDLGLSVNWSSQNLGATNTASYGSLHCWGDSVGGNSTLEGIRVYFRMEDAFSSIGGAGSSRQRFSVSVRSAST